MEMWNEKLTRENIEAFYNTYAAFAYKCAYRNLRDTTRAEISVVNAFIDTYHKRAKLEADDVIYFFSDSLQLHINDLAAKFPVVNESAAAEKNLDEYTASTMRHTILERIDSPRFRIAEFVSSTPDTKVRRKTPILEYMHNSGVSVMLLIKLVVLAIVIAVVTYFGAFTFFKADDYVIGNTQRGNTKLEERIVSILEYLPVSVKGANNEAAAAGSGETQEPAPELTEETDPLAMTPDDTAPSATRG
ncbi:MAG: hypothetical protein J6Y08_00790 [Clostridiales bacterium]|nr:hypothetical protein [Clostridiales bacterium]